MKIATSRASMLLAVVLAASALTACDESEQGRVLHYEPGVYQGKKDTPIDDSTRDELRQRAQQLAG